MTIRMAPLCIHTAGVGYQNGGGLSTTIFTSVYIDQSGAAMLLYFHVCHHISGISDGSTYVVRIINPSKLFISCYRRTY